MISTTKFAYRFLQKGIISTVKPSFGNLGSLHKGTQRIGLLQVFKKELLNTNKFMFCNKKNESNVSDKFK